MTIINTPDINLVRKQIQKIKKENPSETILVKAQDEEFNKKILENSDVDVLLSSEIHNRKDYKKQRDSGLNEYLCRLAKKNNIKIGINLDELKNIDKKSKAKVLSRIIQNIYLCKKVKTDIIIFPKGKYSKQDIMAFMLSLKSSTGIAKKAI